MWDAFISYASEDRRIAADLAAQLQNRGLEVWYDGFALRIGDSIRQSIEQGLAQSRFGVVILSRAFFCKDWPQRELNGLFSLEVAGRKMILPVWHNISDAEVRNYSPILADRLGVSTEHGITRVAERITEAIKTAGDEFKPPSDKNTWPETSREFVLRVLKGSDCGAVFPLNRERLIVGRSTTADIRLSEPAASRSHFAITWDSEHKSHAVVDWGHPNSILLNGEVIDCHSRSVLTLGDELQLGDTVLKYEGVVAHG